MLYRDALNLALDYAMEHDPRVVVLGEDVGFYGGNYKVTDGLYVKYGPKRVIDTPIAENSIVGTAIGMALMGLRPVAEIMTVNFAMLAMDQFVNQMAKLRYMSGGKLFLPLVVRMPQGVAKQLASQHSQSLEHFFASVPGLYVFCASDSISAYHGLLHAIRMDDPVVFLEHVLLYGMDFPFEYVKNFDPFKARILKEGKDITVVSYLKMVHDTLKACEWLEERDGISCEVIDLISLRPIDFETIYESVRKTHRLVVVYEAPKTLGLGAELSARVCEELFYYLDAPPLRIAGEEVPIPYNRKLELMAIPTPEKIYERILSWSKSHGL
ncbi:alpha-ketoacid dehydrogenase subunit beta [Pampinifervens florentissimum]|uniref:alpha-ketoacid dehydrogenase subunit beta n=1 Tax=Pampinifervens florentissimum TaxID=1632019 RepID=UPI0013B47E94|nr:alpha-ketoacid dehydrogenase subunit beta [Hydrogenobacter sp. T-8]QID32805.1 alpha-ketoacid dehydrogenase subunit beta [Hydrogenobacter sp. T-8]